MRPIVAVFIAFAVALPFCAPAEAQIALPRKSRSEQRVEELNRSIQQQTREQQLEQQIQSQNNQLRQDFERQLRMYSPPPSGLPSGLGRCPVGSAGCY